MTKRKSRRKIKKRKRIKSKIKNNKSQFSILSLSLALNHVPNHNPPPHLAHR